MRVRVRVRVRVRMKVRVRVRVRMRVRVARLGAVEQHAVENREGGGGRAQAWLG